MDDQQKIAIVKDVLQKLACTESLDPDFAKVLHDEMWDISEAKPDAKNARIAALEAALREAARSLETIARFSPEWYNLPISIMQEMSECEECKKLQANKYSMSRFCSKHYSDLCKRDKRNENAYKGHYMCLQDIARAAYVEAEAVLKGEQDDN